MLSERKIRGLENAIFIGSKHHYRFFMLVVFVAWINGGVIQKFCKKGSTWVKAQENLVAMEPSYSSIDNRFGDMRYS